MERIILKRRNNKQIGESITYHFGDNKIISGTKRPDIEINPVFSNNEKEDEEEEKEMEFECIQPDIKKEDEEDPLKIDDIKPDMINSETDSKLTGFLLWFANRRKELLKTDQKQNSIEGKEDISNNEPRKIITVEKKLNTSKSIQQKQKSKDKRYTAYTLWRKEMRVNLQCNHSDMTFKEISLFLSEKWKSLTSYEKFKYRKRAKSANEKIVNFKKKGEKKNLETIPSPKSEEDKKISRKGRIISKPTKLADFCNIAATKETKKRKSKKRKNHQKEA